MIFSPDGHCRAFDADAAGTVIGSGVGVVVLKRLSEALADGDTVHAVIKGTAINNDGASKPGYSAPSVTRQAAVISEALRVAQCPPDTISYVEAHGTGTPLGDPIEVAALTEVFGSSGPKARTVLGSVKTNLGHLDTAAGMAGLIKTALMLRHRTLVPSLHFRFPNPEIDFAAGPFTVGTKTTEWPADDRPRRAGVSSFGVGGTNAHAVLQEPPRARPPLPARTAEVLMVSARTPEALVHATDDLARHLKHHPGLDLAAVAHTLAAGRRHHLHRRAVVAADARQAALSLAILDPDRVRTAESQEGAARFAFVFSSADGAVLGAVDAYREVAAFREAVDACAAAIGGPQAVDPEAVLTGSAGKAVAAFAAQYALAATCQAWKLRPGALVGSGAGAAVVGCLAGTLDLADALALADGGDLLVSRPAAKSAPPLAVGSGRGWLDPDEAADPRTWTHAVAAEQSAEGAVDALLRDAGLVRIDFDAGRRPRRSATDILLHAVAEAWTRGAPVDVTGWYGSGRRLRVPLPTYPFQRVRHWVDAPSLSAAVSPAAGRRPGTLRRRVETAAYDERSPILQEFLRAQVADVLEADGERLPEVDENLFHLGVDSLILIDLLARLERELGRAVTPSFDDAPTIRGIADQVADCLAGDATAAAGWRG